MIRLRLSLSLNLEMRSAQQTQTVSLPLVWLETELNTWKRLFRRGQRLVERVSTALKVASIGLEAARFGAGI